MYGIVKRHCKPQNDFKRSLYGVTHRGNIFSHSLSMHQGTLRTVKVNFCSLCSYQTRAVFGACEYGIGLSFVIINRKVSKYTNN